MPDLSGVTAWQGGGALPEGWHDCRIEEPELSKSTNDNPQIDIRLISVAGPAVGGRTRDRIVITANSLGKIKGVMESAGMPIPVGAFQLDERQLAGRVVAVLVRLEEDRNGDTDEDGNVKRWPRVKAYAAPMFGGAGAPQSVPAAMDITPGPGASAASATDDDIPF